MLRIGVDVGGKLPVILFPTHPKRGHDCIPTFTLSLAGTNTDGVLIDVTRLNGPGHGVLAHYKSPTTTEVSKGIENAIREVLKSAAVASSEVTSVSIGTTAFINAVLEADARRLAKVAVIRLCGLYTRQCPPFIDFPKRLRTLTEGHVGYVDGGFESGFLEPSYF